MRNNEADVIGSEQLVQRFVDNELSSAERVQLLMRLGRDGALRGRLIELEQIAAGAGRLSRPAVPAGFVSYVMERTAPRRSLGQRLRETLWTPRALQWNLASALWSVSSHPLSRDPASGAWTTLVLLSPGEHLFMYVVDGTQWLSPPAAEDYVDDGFGARNGVVMVR